MESKVKTVGSKVNDAFDGKLPLNTASLGYMWLEVSYGLIQ